MATSLAIRRNAEIDFDNHVKRDGEWKGKRSGEEGETKGDELRSRESALRGRVKRERQRERSKLLKER